MSKRDKSTLLKMYRRKIHNNLKNYNFLRLEYDRMQKEYDHMIDVNQKAYFSGKRIKPVLTSYVLEAFQVITDAYIYKIDPMTGCIYERS